MSDDLTAFLKARLYEEQYGAQFVKEMENGARVPVTNWLGVPFADRMLREVDAKRAILGRHEPLGDAGGHLSCAWCSGDVDTASLDMRWPCPDVLSIAAVYRSHPDFRAEWSARP